MSFNFTCPYCKATLEAEDSWAGRETTCPACSERVVISPDAPTPATRISAAPVKESADSMQKPEPAVSSEKHRDSGKEFNGKLARICRLGGGRKYIWGRLYISSIWILVGLVLIAGICTIIFNTSQYNTEKNLRREALWKNIPLLQEKQTAFLEHLEDTIDLLAEKKQLGTKNQSGVTGFQLPDSIRRKEFVFNEELDSIESVEESIATMEECIQTIQALESGLEKNLEDQLRGLQSLIRGAANRSRTVAPLTEARRRAGAIQTGFSRQVRFYLSENDQFSAIQAIRQDVAKVSRLYPDNQKLKNDLNQLLGFLDFIENNLLSRSFRLQLEQLHGNFTTQQNATAEVKKKIPGEQEYENINRQLARLYLAWSDESDMGRWYIAVEAKALQRDLVKHFNGIYQEEEIANFLFHMHLFNCLKIAVFSIVLCFILLVVADMLRIHFDCAEKILQKQEE